MPEQGPFKSSRDNQFLLDVTADFPSNKTVLRYYSSRIREGASVVRAAWSNLPLGDRLVFSAIYIGVPMSMSSAGYGLYLSLTK